MLEISFCSAVKWMDGPYIFYPPPPSLKTTKVAVRPGVGPKSAVRPGSVVRQAGNFFLPKYEKKLRSDQGSDRNIPTTGPTGGRSLDKTGR